MTRQLKFAIVSLTTDASMTTNDRRKDPIKSSKPIKQEIIDLIAGKMKRILLLPLFSLFHFLSFAQTQIGSTIYGTVNLEELGSATVISGDGTVMAVGSPTSDYNGANLNGSVRIFKNVAGTWTQIGNKIVGAQVGEAFGISIALSDDGSIIAIGAMYNHGIFGNTAYPGAVRVYKNVSGVWTQIGSSLSGMDSTGTFGKSVSLSADGSILAVGAPGVYYNYDRAGEVKIYKNIANVWTQIGTSIKGNQYGSRLGISISLSNDGNRIIVGAPVEDNTYTIYRFAQVYENVVGVWTKIGADIFGEALNGKFGSSVSISGDGTKVAVGDYMNNVGGVSAGDRGSTRVYQYNSSAGGWQKIGQDIDGIVGEEQLSGYSVSLSDDGNILAIGAPNNPGTSYNGSTRVYKNNGSTWTQIGSNILGLGIYNQNGYSVSLSGDGKTLGVGAIKNNGTINTGYARAYDLSSIILATQENSVENDIKIYPNPVKSHLNISLGKKINSIIVYDMLGQEVLSKMINSKEANIEVPHLTTGTYLVKITSEGKVKTIKITKE